MRDRSKSTAITKVESQAASQAMQDAHKKKPLSPQEAFAEQQKKRVEFLKKYLPQLDSEACQKILEGSSEVQQQQDAAHLAQLTQDSIQARHDFYDTFEKTIQKSTRAGRRLSRKDQDRVNDPVNEELESQLRWAEKHEEVQHALRPREGRIWSFTGGETETSSLPPFLQDREEKQQNNTSGQIYEAPDMGKTQPIKPRWSLFSGEENS